MIRINIENISIKDNSDEKILLSEVNFHLENNKIYSILGNNGTGKSTLLKSMVRLLDKRYFMVTGRIDYHGIDLLSLRENELRKIRENKIRYIFQDAPGMFDPLRKLGYYLINVKAEKEKAELLLSFFLLPSYDYISELFPYEASSGMLQRFAFVIALLAEPELIILDEPSSALDPIAINLMIIKLREFVCRGNNIAVIVTQDSRFGEKVSDKIFITENRTIREYKFEIN